MGLAGDLSSMFGGTGDVGATAIDQGVGYSPEIPMSTGVDTGFNVPAQPTDASGGPSQSFWQSLVGFLGMGGSGGSSPNTPETPEQKQAKAEEIMKFGKFLQSAQGAQTSLQNSKLAQQMLQQHINQPQNKSGGLPPPTNMATRILMQAGLM